MEMTHNLVFFFDMCICVNVFVSLEGLLEVNIHHMIYICQQKLQFHGYHMHHKLVHFKSITYCGHVQFPCFGILLHNKSLVQHQILMSMFYINF